MPFRKLYNVVARDAQGHGRLEFEREVFMPADVNVYYHPFPEGKVPYVKTTTTDQDAPSGVSIGYIRHLSPAQLAALPIEVQPDEVEEDLDLDVSEE